MKPLFRPDTWDTEIWRCVNDANEYGLPAAFSRDDVIFDIGAHVGGFSHACLSRGAGRVFAFEADRANYGLAVHNLSEFGDRARVYHLAVWRSDRPATTLRFSGYGTTPTGASNTGGGNVLWPGEGTGQAVKTTDLDSLLRAAGKVRLLKIDCESAEFPILLTCTELARVEEIVGEYHEIGGCYNAAAIPEAAKVGEYGAYMMETLGEYLGLGEYLARAGFIVTTERSRGADGQYCNLGKFRAVRR